MRQALRPCGGTRQGWTKNRENNPMQSKNEPRLAVLVLRRVRGTRSKNAPSSRPQPNLILL
jgi:hypothetical protein